MTKKKEKDQDKAEEVKNASEKNLSDAEEANQIQAENEIKQEISEKKVELLEEKEGAGLTLEFFSKEKMVDKLKELKECVEQQDAQIKQLTEWKDKFMRLQAEFENTQKRWEKNRQYLKSQYTASTLKGFLPLYDSFKKAIENATEDNQIKQFYNQFMGILKFLGAEPMETKINDYFDYNQHEALTFVEKEDIEENRILDIIQEGWKYDKDVLRYAKVVISKKPKPPEPEPEPKAEAEVDGEVKREDEIEAEASSTENEKETEKLKEEAPKKEENKESDKNEYIS